MEAVDRNGLCFSAFEVGGDSNSLKRLLELPVKLGIDKFNCCHGSK
ncbi:hypothetical protein FACS1894113_4700 [Alphaproteobacteria bacterium]|nr:hypothetical protein FACS1894113_4700 [Alphaproteobacteria bacterium]